MSKVKKVFAIILSMAMILGMSLTAFAATSTTITINNAGSGSFKAVQVVETDTTAETGWEIVTAYQAAFKTAFDVTNTQTIIKGMIYSVNPKHENAEEIENFDSKYQDALETICSNIDMTVGTTAAVDDVAKLTVSVTGEGKSTAGVWTIHGVEDDYSYSPMAAYISFAGAVTPSTGINAKKAPSTIEKNTTDNDKVVEIGQTIGYEITTRVPYIPTSDSNRHYFVNDTISGARYKTELNTDTQENELTVTVTVKESQADDATTASKTYKVVPTGSTFSVDISDFLLQDEEENEANPYQNWYLTISYEAIAEAVTVENDVEINGGEAEGDPEYGSDSETVYTGQITLTKYNEDSSEKLAGAGFEVRKGTATDMLTFRADSYTEVEGEQVPVPGSYTYDPEGTITEVFTGADGTLVIKGLDVGTYNFKETTAPEGFHIKNDSSGVDATATLAVQGTTATANLTATTELTNSELSSLPSTGGIGTTIFTVGGCVIMIAAAGLFFASRRKESK